MKSTSPHSLLRTVPLLFALAVSAALPVAAATQGLSAEVNTFIGSKDDGNTFPGASAPFGMIQVSPIGSHYSGWRYDDPQIGFTWGIDEPILSPRDRECPTIAELDPAVLPG